LLVLRGEPFEVLRHCPVFASASLWFSVRAAQRLLKLGALFCALDCSLFLRQRLSVLLCFQ
jgi:hypothetical protein